MTKVKLVSQESARDGGVRDHQPYGRKDMSDGRKTVRGGRDVEGL